MLQARLHSRVTGKLAPQGYIQGCTAGLKARLHSMVTGKVAQQVTYMDAQQGYRKGCTAGIQARLHSRLQERLHIRVTGKVAQQGYSAGTIENVYRIRLQSKLTQYSNRARLQGRVTEYRITEQSYMAGLENEATDNVTELTTVQGYRAPQEGYRRRLHDWVTEHGHGDRAVPRCVVTHQSHITDNDIRRSVRGQAYRVA